MNRADATAASTRSANFLTLVGVVAVLYFAQEVLIPIAMAILLSFLLAPLVVRLRRLGLPRVPAVLITVGVTTIVLGVTAWGVANQLLDAIDDLPNYHGNIESKIHALRPADAEDSNAGLISRATNLFDKLSEEFTAAQEMAGEPPTLEEQRDIRKPILVEVYSTDPAPFRTILEMLMPVLAPAGQAGIVFVFVVFILLQREDLRDRMIRLIGGGNLNVTTQAMNDAGYRVSRYLMMQLIVNLTYGIPVGLGLWLIGIPAPLLWGILATLLRFIPYIGPWIAAAFPIMMATAVDPGWNSVLLAVALFVALELFSNNVMEPWLYGSTTGISPVAILVAAVFWTWLWGPIGLILSTPLTVCLLVLGKYWAPLEFLSILLADEPGLTPDARYYQRLLALDPDTSTEIAEEYLREHTLLELYDEVLLRALSLAEQDRHRGALDDLREEFVVQQTREIIETSSSLALQRGSGASAEEEVPEAAEAVTAPAPIPLPQHEIVCLPARDEADELAGEMLSELLEQQRMKLHVLSTAMLAGEFLEALETRQTQVICISALPPFATMHARYLCKRVRKRFPTAQIIVCIWNPRLDVKRLQERFASSGPDAIVTSMEGAVVKLRAAVASVVPPVDRRE